MYDFTFPEIRGVSLSLREEGDELDPTPEPSSEEGGIVLNDGKEKSGFPQISNLFIVVAIVLIVAVLINFLLRRRRIRFGRIPNAPAATPGGHMPAVPLGTNSLYPDALPTYDGQPQYHGGNPQYQGGQPQYPYQQAPHSQPQHQAYPHRQNPQHSFVPFG